MSSYQVFGSFPRVRRFLLLASSSCPLDVPSSPHEGEICIKQTKRHLVFSLSHHVSSPIQYSKESFAKFSGSYGLRLSPYCHHHVSENHAESRHSTWKSVNCVLCFGGILVHPVPCNLAAARENQPSSFEISTPLSTRERTNQDSTLHPSIFLVNKKSTVDAGRHSRKQSLPKFLK